MKKIILLLMVITVSAFSQTVNDRGSWGGGIITYLDVRDWQPFASDSLATAYTATFDVSGVDSIAFYNYSSSTNGTAKYTAELEISPEVANGYDSIGRAADTTNVKLEAMNYIGTVVIRATNGKGRIKVVGNAYAATSATQNRADTYVNIYMTLYKRQVAYRAQ